MKGIKTPSPTLGFGDLTRMHNDEGLGYGFEPAGDPTQFTAELMKGEESPTTCPVPAVRVKHFDSIILGSSIKDSEHVTSEPDTGEVGSRERESKG